MKYNVLDDYLVIEPQSAETKTKSGIFIPSEVAEKNRPRIGKILDIGDKIVKNKFKKGDRVIYKIWGGNFFKDPDEGGKEVLFVLEEDILAIVKK